ncbi:hypothetical protein NBC122_00370 [Chryseobacterium salivictor]|uniref:Uncharacterized protein n=1 Tax=Chryseobacterium salivictor TaxID=2547600 RepID=A0A4P6ZCT4_9FLAO|nr:hypothetical protein NBC122_00370 [Chryseobacterium salivictor]
MNLRTCLNFIKINFPHPYFGFAQHKKGSNSDEISRESSHLLGLGKRKIL